MTPEDHDQITPFRQSVNACWHLGHRPLCPCCGGGKVRKGYTQSKAKSRRKTHKAQRKARQFNNRNTIRKNDHDPDQTPTHRRSAFDC